MSDSIFLMREALKKMFKPDGHFSICDLDSMIKTFGIFVPPETYNKLRILHCVSWSEMEPETRRWVATTIDALLTNPDNLASNFLPQLLGGKPMALSGAARELIK